MRQANNIEDVITIMDDIVAECEREGSRMGYFAALYRTVTLIVKQRCDEGFFEDNDRMRCLDTIFANRYFAAYYAYRDAQTPSQSWEVSFLASQKRRLIILQHLLLGMNAHISLDLGIAAAEVAEGDMSPSLERDFNRLNNILAGLIDTVQAQVASVSPLLKVGDWLAWRFDELVVSLGINEARDAAWSFANELAPLDANGRISIISTKDAQVAAMSTIIGSVAWYYMPIVWLVAISEPRNVRDVIESLSDESWMQTVHARVDAIVQQAQAQGIDITRRTGAFEQVKLQDEDAG